MKQTKKLRNLKVFAPKRKFLAPRYAELVRPGETRFLNNGIYETTITNVSNKPIYVRYE